MGGGSSTEVKRAAPLKLKIVLKTEIWRDSDDDKGIERERPYNGDLTPRIKQIISNALLEYKVHEWKRDNESATVTLVMTRRKGAVSPKAEMENLHYVFGEGAPDGWMEGDIRIDPDTNNDELDLVLTSVKGAKPTRPPATAAAKGNNGRRRQRRH